MSTLAATHPTLLDLARGLNPDGTVAKVVNLLTQTNDILKDMVWQEGNTQTGNRTQVLTGLPSVTWRKLYGFVQPSKDTTAVVTDSCGMMETYAECDVALAKLSGNVDLYRMQRTMAHSEAIGQELASSIFYANEALNPEEITGLDVRFNDQSAPNGGNILTSAATPDGSDNTSIWLIGWGPDTVFGIYPKGSNAGMTITDKGQQTKDDGTGGMMEVYRTHIKQDAGLVVADWRYVVRINFDLEDVTASGSSGPILADLMAKAIRRIPNLNRVRPAFYLNRDAWDAFDLQANNKSTLAYTTQYDAQGIPTDRFRGIPMRRCDAILSTESGI